MSLFAKPLPMFVELCAGTAAVSVRLQGGKRPPGSRLGAKTGYADAILAVLGLQPGQGADMFVWAEVDPLARSVLWAMGTPGLPSLVRAEIESWYFLPQRMLWEALRAEPDPEDVDPPRVRDVARAYLLAQWSFRRGEPRSGFRPDVERGAPKTATHNAGGPRTVAKEAGLWSDLPAMRAQVRRAASFPWGPVEPGTVVYIDPPYAGTTGYEHGTLHRGEVVDLALAWHAAGARVCVSEQAPIEPLVERGWIATDITQQRKGQVRSMSKQQREVVTVSPSR